MGEIWCGEEGPRSPEILEKSRAAADPPGRPRARAQVDWSRGDERRNCRSRPEGSGYMRLKRGHRTHLKWHRTHPVTTGLMRREV